MQLDQRLHQRKAKPSTGVASREGVIDLTERRKHPRDVLGRNSDAGVVDGNRQGTVAPHLGGDGDPAAVRRELDAVGKQI